MTIRRPRKAFDYDQFESLCSYMCTAQDIAEFFNCSIDTVERRVRAKYKTTFKEAHSWFAQAGKVSLRQAQFRNATKRNNPIMQIWLGKQYLGQTDTPVNHDETDKNEVEYDIRTGLYGDAEPGAGPAAETLAGAPADPGAEGVPA